MTQQSTSVRCPSFVSCSGSRFEHIRVQQQLVSSTASPAADVHVLLKLISVAATHTRDEGKKCLVSAALSRSTFSPSLPIWLLHTHPTRATFSSPSFFADRSSFVGSGTSSHSECVTSFCALCREGQSPHTAKRRARSNHGTCPSGVWSTSTRNSSMLVPSSTLSSG